MIDRAEFVKAFLESSAVQVLPSMPAEAFTSFKMQRAYLEKHIVTGHFHPASNTTISWVKQGGSPIEVVDPLCVMTVVNGDAGFRTWNLSKIFDPLTPGETIYWTMRDQWGSFCMGAVRVGEEIANA